MVGSEKHREDDKEKSDNVKKTVITKKMDERITMRRRRGEHTVPVLVEGLKQKIERVTKIIPSKVLSKFCFKSFL